MRESRVYIWLHDLVGDAMFGRVYGPVLASSVFTSDERMKIMFSTGQNRPCRTRCLGPYVATSDGRSGWVVSPGFPGAGETFSRVTFIDAPPMDQEVHDLVTVVERLDAEAQTRRG